MSNMLPFATYCQVAIKDGTVQALVKFDVSVNSVNFSFCHLFTSSHSISSFIGQKFHLTNKNFNDKTKILLYFDEFIIMIAGN